MLAHAPLSLVPDEPREAKTRRRRDRHRSDLKNPYLVRRYEGRSRSVQMDTWRARKDLCALPEEDPVSPEEPREAPPRDAEASPLRGYVVVGVWDDPPPDEASRLRRALSWLRTWLRRE